MGIVALIISIVAMILAFIPFFNILGIILAVAAFILGIINLISLQSKHQKGWGKPLAAIIISMFVGWISMFSSTIGTVMLFVPMIEKYCDEYDCVDTVHDNYNVEKRNIYDKNNNRVGTYQKYNYVYRTNR